MIEGRKRICLFSGLFWAITLMMCFLTTEIFDLDPNWLIVLISLLPLFLGIFTLFGHIGLYFPFIFMTKKDLTEYNIEKASFFLGISMIIFSCTLLLITVSVYFLIFPISIGIVTECGGIYVCASNKFKADTKQKH
jgi:hypothetical protein